MMQYIGRRYVPYINYSYGRSGTLWEGRFKSNLVETESYLLTCCRYIELNPVRAGMVERPEQYRWSSHSHNADGERNSLITEHPRYTALGRDRKQRQIAYRGLFGVEPNPDQLKKFRACLQTGTPLGNDRFRDEIERTLGCKVGKSSRGRPRKPHDVDEPAQAESQQEMMGL